MARRGIVRRPKRSGDHDGRAVAGEAGDAVNPRGLNGLGKGHRRQDGGESAGQHRLARTWGTKEKDIMGRTPASSLALPIPIGLPTAATVDPPLEQE